MDASYYQHFFTEPPSCINFRRVNFAEPLAGHFRSEFQKVSIFPINYIASPTTFYYITSLYLLTEGVKNLTEKRSFLPKKRVFRDHF